jgi:hypothetical protein
MGPGLDVRGVREWRPGDAVRHVHWRSTARTGRLTVLEYGEPTIGVIGVVFAGWSGESGFEALLATGAATIATLMADGVHAYAWLEQSGIGCAGALRNRSLPRLFATVENPTLPSENGVAHLLEHIGAGGLLLVAAAVDVPAAWRAHVDGAAFAHGVTVLDLADAVLL